MAMEGAAARTPGAYSIYGSIAHKQVYLYGGLDTSPTLLTRGYGMAWGVGGWLLPNFLAKAGMDVAVRLRTRVADELTTTFASHYTDEITLAEALDADVMKRYNAKKTGEKFLFDVEAMDTLLGSAVNDGEVIGVSALVFDEGKVVYQNAFGLRDRERDQPVELDTVFRIYSMTKPITAVLIMDLVEEGKIDLDDPVSKYIPELGNMQVASADEDGNPVFSPQENPMTIKDLLLHRAGIGYGIYGPINPVEVMYEKAGLFNPTEDLSVKMQKLSQLPLVAQPGEGWYYSYSIDVLGHVAEVVTGDDLGSLFEERIFKPLGMTETGFQVRPDQKARFASNYAVTENGFVLQDDGQTSGYLSKSAYQSGGGGLVSTLGDYSKFAQMLLQKGSLGDVKILKSETVEMMMQDQMDADDKFMMPWVGAKENTGFGFGGSVVTATSDNLAVDGKIPGIWGWGGMAKTNFHIDQKNGAYGVIMLQFFTESEPEVLDSFRALVTQEVSD